MIKVVSFDIGGTLISLKSEPNKIRVLANYLAADEQELRAYIKPILYCGNKTIKEISVLLKSKHGQDCEDLLKQLYTPISSITVHKSALHILKRLKAEGYKLAVITNHNSLRTYPELPFIDMFDYVIKSNEVGLCKPDKKIFDYLVNWAKVKPEEILHIGDHLVSDYHGATDAGLKAILISKKPQNKEVFTIDCLSKLNDIDISKL